MKITDNWESFVVPSYSDLPFDLTKTGEISPTFDGSRSISTESNFRRIPMVSKTYFSWVVTSLDVLYRIVVYIY